MLVAWCMRDVTKNANIVNQVRFLGDREIERFVPRNQYSQQMEMEAHKISTLNGKWKISA